MQLKRGDTVRIVVPSGTPGRIRRLNRKIGTVLNVVDNSLNEYKYPVVVQVPGHRPIAVRQGEVVRYGP